MQRPELANTGYRLAVAGEQTGFSLEDMISMQNAGLTVSSLMELIERRFTEQEQVPCASRWVV